MKKLTAFFFLLLLLPTKNIAQVNEQFPLPKLHSFEQDQSPVYPDTATLNFLFQPANDNTLHAINDSLLQQDLASTTRKTGLSASANYNNFLVSDIGNLGNQSRVSYSAGLQWKLLKGGLLDNKKEQDVIEHTLEQHRLQAAHAEKKEEYGWKYNLILYLFNEEKLAHTVNHVAFLEYKLELMQKLYENYMITYDKVLLASNEIDVLKNTQHTYYAFNQALANQYEGVSPHLSSYGLLPLEIDMDSIAGMEDSLIYEQLKDVEKRKIATQDKLTQGVSFNVSARYNYYNQGVDRNVRVFPSVGFSVSVPLEFKTQGRKETIRLKHQEIDTKYEHMAFEQKKELVNEYYAYQYKVKQYITFHGLLNYHGEMVRQLELKKSSLKPGNEVLEILTHYDVMFQIQGEMIDLRSQLYIQLLKMYTKQHNESDYFTHALPIQLLRKSVPTSKMEVTITQADLNKDRIEFTINYLKAKRWKQVRISHSDLRKSQDALELIQSQGINVSVAFNRWEQINTSDLVSLQQDVFDAGQLGAKGIVISLPQLGRNSKQYAQALRKVIFMAKVTTKANNLFLHIYLPENIEQQEVSSLKQAFQDCLFSTPMNKLNLNQVDNPCLVALTPQRFESIQSLEQYANNIVETRDLDLVYLGSMQSILKLGHQSIKTE